MATFKIEISDKRKDGTYCVRIRVTHNRELRRISTHLRVDDSDLNTKKEIKNQEILDLCENILRKCREASNSLGVEMLQMPIDTVTSKVKAYLLGDKPFELDFIAYMLDRVPKMKSRTGNVYRTTAIQLNNFIAPASTLDISKIDRRFLHEFETYLSKRLARNTVTLYLNCIRATHNVAKIEFNDDDRGVLRIPFSPFNSFKIPKMQMTAKRAISVEKMQHIINAKPPGKVLCIAQDAFIISFALIGMNAADLYIVKPAIDGVLTYNRSKTKDRRADKAEMRVKIPPCIDALVEKYKDPTGERMFNFYRRYSSIEAFNQALSRGMRKIAEINFYAARHTWATLARSAAVGIDKYTVHEALNHVDSDMKITDIYIDKDWSVIWNANDKVLALFDWTAVGYDVI